MVNVQYVNQIEHGNHFTMQVYLDFANKRLRLDDYRGNLDSILARLMELAKENNFTKIIVKSRIEHWQVFLNRGYVLEGVFTGYFKGSDGYSMALFLSDERRTSEYWLEEDEIVRGVQALPRKPEGKPLPDGYHMRLAERRDAKALAHLYGAVFQTYPTPMNDEKYIEKVMEEGTIFYLIETKDEIVSAASAEVNQQYFNAELTDCATLPEHRKYGFMKTLIIALEKELLARQIYCSYSIARALSFGMNAVFHQLGYEYTGRLAQNCNIYDKIEDMNVWVKNLSD